MNIRVATDPPVSERQRRAMEAAAHGHSTLGISKKVGEEFVSGDAEFNESDHPRAENGKFGSSGAGELKHDKDSETWEYGSGNVPGSTLVKSPFKQFDALSKLKPNKYMAEKTAVSAEVPVKDLESWQGVVEPEKIGPLREDYPEIDVAQIDGHLVILNGNHRAASAFASGTGNIRAKVINYDSPENRKYKREKDAPVQALSSKVKVSKGAQDDAEPEHAQDSALALDKATARRIDLATGHMHVESTPISKANVCGYLGSEINEVMRDKPGWVPLAPDVMYQMLRDPDELAKAADSFNGKPLLLVHKPLSATDHPKELVIGSTGTKAVFEDPYLKNDLSVWEQDGIEGIESDAKKELSSAYSYRADMTPGTFRGAKYDGVMRDIRGNHVAVVKEGRAGPDVVVGDAAIPKLEELFDMTKTVLTRKAAMVQGAVAVFLAPRLAQDARVDLNKVFNGVTHKDYPKQKDTIALAVTALCKGHLRPEVKVAADGVEGLKTMLDALEPMEPMEGPDTDASSGLPMSAEEMQKKTMDNDPWMKIEALLKGKVDDATLMAIKTMMAPPAGGMDAETEEERKKKEAEDKMARDKEMEAGKADHVSKPAMDAAVKAAAEATEKRVLASQKALREAERFVKPWVGELAVACDSAEAVHREALKIMGVTIEADLDPRALPSIIRAQPVPGAKPAQQSTHVAQDSAAASDYNKEFPGAERIRVIG